MRNFTYLTSVLLFLTTIFAQKANAQCGWPGNTNQGGAFTPACGSNNSIANFRPDGYATFNFVTGAEYYFETCGTMNWDGRISIYENSSGTAKATNDDACLNAIGVNQASALTWTSDFTGVARVINTVYTCPGSPGWGWFSGMTSATLVYRQNNNISSPTPTRTNSDICAGGSSVFSAAPTAGSGASFGYTWQYSPNNSTWSNVANGTPAGSSYSGASSSSLTVSGITAAGTYYYRYIASLGQCATASSSNTLVVVADPAVTTNPTSPADICIGGTTANMSIASSGGTPSRSFQWQYSPDGSTGWGNVSNGTPAGSSYTNATSETGFNVAGITTAGTYYYRCFVSASGSGCGTAVSANAVVNVVADPSITTHPTSPAAICVGGTTANMSIASSGGTPSRTFQWQFSLDNSSWGNVSNNTPAGSTYNNANAETGFNVAGITAPGTYYYRCLVSASGSGCGAVASSSATVSVVADPAVTTNPTSPAAICIGGTTANMSIVSSGGTPSRSYQWQYSTTGTGGWGNVANGTPSGSTYANSTSETGFNVAGITTAGTYYYRCFVSASGNGCGTAVSANAVVDVVADPSITTHPTSPAAICVGGTTANMSIASAGGTPSRSFQWQYSTTGTGGWSNVANGTPSGSAYTNATSETGFNVAGISTAGTYYYRCLVSSGGSGCDPIPSNNAVVTVVADPAVVTNPTSVTVCRGGSNTFTASASGGTPTLNYNWQYFNSGTWENVTNGIPTGISYSGSTTTSLTVSTDAIATSTGSYQYRMFVSATGSGCASVITSSANLIVNEKPSITSNPSTTSVCEGTPVSFSMAASGGIAPLTITWQYDNAGTWVNAANGTPASSTYSGLGTSNVTISGLTSTPYFTNYPYRVLVTSSGSGCDAAITSTANATINKIPDITNSGVALCEGASKTLTSNIDPNVNWTISPACVGCITGGNVFNAPNPGGASTNFTIFARNANNSTCANFFTQTVFSQDPSDAGVDQAQCSSGAFSLAGNIPNFGTGAWQCITNCAGVNIATPASNTSSVTGVGAGVTSTLRWRVTNGSCISDDFVTLTNANPSTAAAGINASINGDLCAGVSTTLTVSGGSLGTGASWQWYSASCGGTPEGTGTSITETPTATTTYFVRAEGIGCPPTACASIVVTSQPYNVTGTPILSATGTATSNGACLNSDGYIYYFLDPNNTPGDADDRLMFAMDHNGNNLGTVNIEVEVMSSAGVFPPAQPSSQYCPSVSELYLGRVWDVTTSNAPATPVDCRFYFLDSEFTTFVADATAENTSSGGNYGYCYGVPSTLSDLMMTVIHSSSALELFNPISLSGGPLAGSQQLDFALSEFSKGFLHSNGGIHGANPLPVTYLYIEANAVDNSYIRLDWATATEINNSGFDVQRSTDGTNWVSIGWVAGNNNSTAQINYNYSDYNVEPNTRYYYRLKQIDNDGDFEISTVVSAIISGAQTFGSVSVIPNPSNGFVQVRVNSTVTAEATITLTDILGRNVSESINQLGKGLNTYNFDWSLLAEGTYTLTLTSSNEVRSVKLIITK